MDFSPLEHGAEASLLDNHSALDPNDKSAKSSVELQILLPAAQHGTSAPASTDALPEALQAAAQASKMAKEALKIAAELRAHFAEEKLRVKEQKRELERREREQRSRWFP
jgi:hypothetical protein